MIYFLLLFIEFTSDHLYWLGGGVIATLAVLGAIAGAKKSIREELWNPFSGWLIEPRRKKRIERNEQFTQLLADVKDLKEQSSRIEAEVKTNGGSSLKDTVIFIKTDVEKINKDVGYTRAKLRHLDEASPNAIFECDAEANCTFANRAMCELLNADETELLYKNWLVKIVSTEHQRVLQEWKTAIENKCPFDSEQTIIYDSRTRIRVRVQATPRINGGELYGFFGTVVKVCD